MNALSCQARIRQAPTKWRDSIACIMLSSLYAIAHLSVRPSVTRVDQPKRLKLGLLTIAPSV